MREGGGPEGEGTALTSSFHRLLWLACSFLRLLVVFPENDHDIEQKRQRAHDATGSRLPTAPTPAFNNLALHIIPSRPRPPFQQTTTAKQGC